MEWITILLFFAATVMITAYQTGHRQYLFFKLLTGVVVLSTAYGIFLFLLQKDFFITSLFMGYITCVLFDGIFHHRQAVFPESCLYLCFAGAVLPFRICTESIGAWTVYPMVFIFCASVAVIAGKSSEKHQGPMIFYTDKRKRYYFVSVLPCVIWIAEGIMLGMIKSPNLITSIGLFMLILFLLGLTMCLQTEIIRRLKAEEMNQAIDRWQRESRDYMNTIRSQRHDFNLHLHAISGLINSEEYERCREYVQKLVADANAVNDIMPVGDAVVGAMLYNMREEARRRGSDIFYDITYDMTDILCNGFECNKIIGNLLQNAIDALQSSEDKACGIKLSIFKRRGNTVIISENRFTGDPDRIARVFEPGYSTKKGHEGIGLSMVLRTAQLYGGRVYPEFDRERIRFVVNIPNKVNLLKGGEGE